MSTSVESIQPLESGWENALKPVSQRLTALREELVQRRQHGERILPEPPDVLRAFRQPFDEVKVLIIGQDPYPTPGHPIGLSFAVNADVRPLPRSLGNIYRELETDLEIRPAAHGDLTAWTRQGVLLLNRCLTVNAGDAGSHRGIGWEAITEHAVRSLVARGTPLVSVLWGAQAKELTGVVKEGDHTRVISSAHPSPLSARRGFFGSRPFSQVNEALMSWGAEPVDWRLSTS